MLQMGNGVHDGRLAVFLQEAGIECGLCHTTLGCKGTHLVVGQVTGMVAECPTTAVAAHDGHAADLKGIVETFLCRMTQIDHDAKTVHLTDDLFAETTHATVGVAAPGGVAYLIVAIVTERHIDDATLGEVLQVLQLSVECQSVLDAQHDRLTSIALVLIEVAWRTGNTDIGLVFRNYLLDLIEDEIGVFQRAGYIEINE